MTECLNFARSYRDVTEYEQSANAVLAREGIGQAIPGKLVERAQIMYEQIQPFLLTGSVLDLGCGDARLARLLAQNGFAPQLADVYKNKPTQKVNVPFNFNSPEVWKQTFEQTGLKQERIIHLGVDQQAVPEYHALHVLIALK